jgi:four helix bundle protein
LSKVSGFEDLRIWQEARKICQWVALIGPEIAAKKLYRLKDQLEGSSGSIMDNIAEGYERTGKKEFINFLIIAKASAGEYRSQIYRLLDNGIIYNSDAEAKISQAIALSKQITAFITYLKNSEVEGWRFKEPPPIYGNQEGNESHFSSES